MCSSDLKQSTGIDAISWAKKAEKLGAGEILLTSIDQDGTRSEERRVGKECRSRWSPYH